ncbi:chitinase [Allokutzneria oryzae]|uniref:Chitinase n=1 Tax=Allokutzneria oryzae TaxID=1378989 RepID=A0ABV6A487_9PSEU
MATPSTKDRFRALIAALIALVAVAQPASASTVDIRFAPYIDITMERPTLTEVARATGVKNFTLAFALGSHAGCDPKWGGTIDLTEPRIINQIRELKAMGGDVVIATGGALGPYLEHVCGSAADLAGAYRKILDATGANHIDVDVEAAIPADLVNQALATIQRERGTAVSYTLRVQGQDYGVDPFSVQILQSAARNNVDVLVNPMLMNFGYTGDWGDAMITASQSVLRQMKEVWPSRSDAELRRKLGVTPMIGRNDTGMTTTQAHARKLLAWAKSNGIGFIGFWSAGRDNGSCAGGGVSPTCSGIAQSQWEFTTIFKAF